MKTSGLDNYLILAGVEPVQKGRAFVCVADYCPKG